MKMRTALVRTERGNLQVKRYEDYKSNAEFASEMKDFNKEQKIAIMNYLITSMGITKYERNIDGLCNMGNVFKCIDKMNEVLDRQTVSLIIENRDDFYKILFA